MDQDNTTWTVARTPGVIRETVCTVVHQRTASLDSERGTDEGSEVHAGRRQTVRRELNSQSTGRPRLKYRPSSRTGENPLSGMIGGRWKRRHHSKPDSRHRPTRPGPWGRPTMSVEWRCFTEKLAPTLNGVRRPPRETRRMEANLSWQGVLLGAGLTGDRAGKAPSDRPALEPYRGKPAVRHLREDGGNVGII